MYMSAGGRAVKLQTDGPAQDVVGSGLWELQLVNVLLCLLMTRQTSYKEAAWVRVEPTDPLMIIPADV